MMTSAGKDHASILRFVEIAALVIGLAAAVFAIQSAQAQTYNVLHSFTGGADGATPDASLVLDASGNLYGTTSLGGASNLGTVFKLDSTGNETVLHSFTGGADGATPQADLVLDAAGNLYGTTSLGGASNFGTVFKLNTTGTETVLYSFSGGGDGKLPYATLVMDPSGNLYGTTSLGGTSNSGTVFKLDMAGTETVLYSFTGGEDGKAPLSRLILDAAGNLYGTTNDGGIAGACFFGEVGCGVVFKLDTSGTETVLYTFTGATDGGNPWAGLTLDAAGNFYGTTTSGGAEEEGVVFKLDKTGKETVLYSFGNEGVEPFGGVVLDAAGNLYGTTTNGSKGFGSVFMVAATGNEILLHSFTGAEGAIPYAGLVRDTPGHLYGTTTAGGAANFGTVFEITITPDFSLAASGLTPGTLSPGGSSTASVEITAVSSFSGLVTLSCSVQPSPALAPQCSISPSSTTPGTSAVLTVRTTGATASTLHPGSGAEPLYALWLPLIGVVAGVGFGSNKRRRGTAPAVALACIFATLAFGVACGGSGTSTRGGGGTPVGNYVISVAGAAGSLQHSFSMTLTVQ